LDELKQSIHETIISIEVSELKTVSSNLFMRLEVCLKQKGDILIIYSNDEFFKQFIYFQKHKYMFLMHSILTAMQDSFSSADDGGAFRAYK
jgi:hypothetical protein